MSNDNASSAHVRNRVLVIALDGGTYKVLEPLIEEGRIPNIASLIEDGCSGTLLSTVPPVRDRKSVV